MESERLCQYLEDILRGLGVKVRYEDLHGPDQAAKGGVCRIKGQRFLFIERTANDVEKIRQLRETLKYMDLEDVYIKPAIRELLDIPNAEGGGGKKGQ